MSATKEFKEWYSERMGHPLGVSMGREAVEECELKIEELTSLLQLCVNDMYKPSGKISKTTARKLLSACQRKLVRFPE